MHYTFFPLALNFLIEKRNVNKDGNAFTGDQAWRYPTIVCVCVPERAEGVRDDKKLQPAKYVNNAWEANFLLLSWSESDWKRLYALAKWHSGTDGEKISHFST